MPFIRTWNTCARTFLDCSRRHEALVKALPNLGVKQRRKKNIKSSVNEPNFK